MEGEVGALEGQQQEVLSRGSGQSEASESSPKQAKYAQPHRNLIVEC